MYQTQVNPFELSKRKISESSGQIAKLLIAAVALSFVLIILVIVMLVIALGSAMVIDPNNPYALISSMLGSVLILAIFVYITWSSFYCHSNYDTGAILQSWTRFFRACKFGSISNKCEQY